MSAYVNFFTKNEDNYISIGSYGRSSMIFRFFSDFSHWEEGGVLTSEIINSVRREVTNKLIIINENVERLSKMKDEVSQFNNSVEEKLEAYVSIDGDLAMWEEEREECNYVIDYCTFLEDIMRSYLNKNTKIVFGTEWCPIDIED